MTHPFWLLANLSLDKLTENIDMISFNELEVWISYENVQHVLIGLILRCLEIDSGKYCTETNACLSLDLGPLIKR